jgi:hypothetical protein
MPCLNLPIEPVGPVIELGISAPLSQQTQGSGSLPVQWIRAIVDTGCTHTSLHSSIAHGCGLSAISKGSANTPGGNVITNIYHGDLVLKPLIGNSPFEWRFPDWQIIEMVSPNPAFDALLGMDLIRSGLLTINATIGVATFCW